MYCATFNPLENVWKKKNVEVNGKKVWHLKKKKQLFVRDYTKFQMREIVFIISFSSLPVFVIAFSMDAHNWKVRVYTWTFHSDFFILFIFF